MTSKMVGWSEYEWVVQMVLWWDEPMAVAWAFSMAGNSVFVMVAMLAVLLECVSAEQLAVY